MLRATAHFFLIGTALLAGRLLLDAVTGPTPTPIEVVQSADASPEEVASAVDDAILIEEGLRRGWARTDPVIRRRLVRNMRFVAGEPDDGPPLDARQERAAVERAMGLDMHRTDPVVRRRLLERAERAIARTALDAVPSDEALRAHLEAHPGRFSRPARVRLSQVFLSRERRHESIDTDAEHLAARLLREAPAPDEAHRYGDPFPHDPRGGTVLLERLARTHGRAFSVAVERAQVGRWSGPHESSYGVHFVWVHEREAGEAPPLSEVRERVVRSLQHDRRAAARSDFLNRLRPHYDVRVVRREERER